MRGEHVNIRCFSLEINPIFEQTGQTIGLYRYRIKQLRYKDFL